ncbi:MAG: site-2 protease family protein [Planctomycetota bacterium]|nr:site-2 protease family protein [Planctomycetota bacterium]MEC8652709.1 site-2 protease family protein [Planctomycetota bacterium]
MIISLTLHEAAHGLVARLGGDPTAYKQGLVTVNPLPHMRRSPIMMVLLPLIMLWQTGGQMCIAAASAPIDARWAVSFPRRAALMALAGPLTNILLAAISFAALYWIARPDPEAPWQEIARYVAIVFLRLNLFLTIFNLLPLPPFDGAQILCGFCTPFSRLYAYFVQLPLYWVVSIAAAWYLLQAYYTPTRVAVEAWLPYSPSY